MKPVAFLSVLLQMFCVSYTTLLAVFSSVELLTGSVGPSQPRELLILCLMAFLVSLWNALIRSAPGAGDRMLLRYTGGTAIVLAVGISWGGFIPLRPGVILIVCAIVAAVYAGTWLYLRLTAGRNAAAINRSLERRSRDWSWRP